MEKDKELMRGNKITRKTFLLGGAAICSLPSIAAFGGLRDDLEFFNADAFEHFNGNEWNGLILDTSTTADIKKQYRNSKGAVRPEAMVLPQEDRNSKVNVQTLTNGRGETSKLVGFRLAYPKDEMIVTDLTSRLTEKPTVWYAYERFSDWRILAFARSGCLAFVARDGARESVQLIVLTTPKRIERAIRGLSRERTEIGNLREKFSWDDTVMQYGSVSVSTKEDGLKVSDKGDLERNLRRRLQQSSGSSHLLYDSSSSVSIYCYVTVAKPKEKEGKVTVQMTMSGDSPYGRIYVSKEETEKFSRGAFGIVNVDNDLILDTFAQVRRSFGRDFERMLRGKLPSSPEAYSLTMWNKLVDDATL